MEDSEVNYAMFENIKRDFARYYHPQEKGGSLLSLVKAACCLEFIATLVYRFGHYIYGHNSKILRFVLRPFYLFLNFFVKITCGIIIPARCVIGPGLYIGHIGLIIVHPDVAMGANCSIAHDVTIGTLGGGKPGVPAIGDDVMIASGARVLGPVSVGNNVKIGANSVVVTDVGDDATAVGVPARIVRK